ncbi:hypothetical protein KIN20_000580 [Parelaphostrongylus tenuis]|uniref:Uncharacterized protein n=1 Tax=Parelaphostrongylus tenuis TaxID=148309 RepID=A0AAD5LVP9_PARTN|nr:hypothetical protein KIN20_000580 [Parelaphostrongylus tenuis]
MILESKWYRRGSTTLDRKWYKWRGRHPAATNLNITLIYGHGFPGILRIPSGTSPSLSQLLSVTE